MWEVYYGVYESVGNAAVQKRDSSRCIWLNKANKDKKFDIFFTSIHIFIIDNRILNF